MKDETSCPKGYWGQDDGNDGGRVCVLDTDGSLRADYERRTNPPPKEEKK